MMKISDANTQKFIPDKFSFLLSLHFLGAQAYYRVLDKDSGEPTAVTRKRRDRIASANPLNAHASEHGPWDESHHADGGATYAQDDKHRGNAGPPGHQALQVFPPLHE